MTITPLQHKTYAFIKQYLADNGYAPSLAEIARGIGISPKSISLVSRHIHALVAAGQLQFDRKGYRNIALTEDSGLTLPLLGRIAAGTPIEAIEDQQSVNIADLIKGDGRFLLEVRGDSMIDEGILDRDLVICRETNRASEGDIVVALIDSLETTLKRISYKVPGRITLIPANPQLKPKAYLPQRVQVQGVFAGLLRIPDR